ncbi:arginine--tRNA ligase [Ahrensia marina]|uniref:Arginine--tRNA ligase n=1 Tax=Ahrensia marina TaxID=1514904 RepID=A0A0N0E7S0_9HYPH|nr:arginine--tRNA ligase [Ahrensia marina]KPB01508.1 arginyl-tRNA synthetase [Ahrensia marina]
MNIFSAFRDRVIAAVEGLQLETRDGGPLETARVNVEPPRDPSHGDIATNAAMVIAKQVGENPRALAEKIVSILDQDADIVETSIAGPGFVNLRISNEFWLNQLKLMADESAQYGRSNVGGGKKVNVEFVSANPTGPMHVGHCRGAVIGDTLANLMKFAGFDVVKEYYINDAGVQIDVLARSVMLRYREALGEAIGDMPEGLYPGDYLVPLGEALAEQYGETLKEKSEEDALAIIKDAAIDAMMKLIREDLAALNVHHDVFFSERTVHEDNATKIKAALNDLTLKGHVYRGTLPPPKGQLPEDWEDREQVLFRSTEVGDDIDRPLVKSDGSYTYFAADVAYFVDKFERGFEEMIFVLGADHGGYVKRMEALARAVSDDSVELTVLLCQLVKLLRNGEPVKMSKRAGQFVTLRDVVDEVGRDPVRFMMVYRKSSEPLDFDFAKVTEQSKDNPVFYVQYASARCYSVFRQAQEQIPGISADLELLHMLDDESEIALVRKLAEFPRIVEAAAMAQEPHRIAFYLYELANSFHGHWNKGNDNEHLRFVKVNNPQLTSARLGLVQGVLNVLRSGLEILGVDAPEEMR